MAQVNVALEATAIDGALQAVDLTQCYMAEPVNPADVFVCQWRPLNNVILYEVPATVPDKMNDGGTKGMPDLVDNALHPASMAVHSRLRAVLLLATPSSDSVELALGDETLSLSEKNLFWGMPSLKYRLNEDNDVILATVLVNPAALARTGELLQPMRLLLNNQSSVHLYLNYSLVLNLHNANHSITITTATGFIVCTQMATCNYTNLWV